MSYQSIARFFVESHAFSDGRVTLTKSDLPHISALRLKPGELVEIVENQQFIHRLKIQEINRSIIDGNIESTTPAIGHPLKLTISQSLPKGDKVSGIVGQCTQLNASTFRIFNSARTVPELNEKKWANKRERLQEICRLGAMQSKQDTIPIVEESYMTVKDLNADSALNLICWEEEKGTTLKKFLPDNPPESIQIVIGPEGGLEPKEVNELIDKGFHSISLGSSILRTELAATYVCAAIQFEYGLL